MSNFRVDKIFDKYSYYYIKSIAYNPFNIEKNTCNRAGLAQSIRNGKEERKAYMLLKF